MPVIPAPEWFLIAAIGAALASGVVSLGADRHAALLRVGAFVLLGFSGAAALGAAALILLHDHGWAGQVPLGLPWLQWHLRVDALGALFLGIIGTGTLAVSVFGPGYVRSFQRGEYSLAVLGLMTGLFVTGMQLVVIADDTFVFMVAWELMSVSSYVLVAFEHGEGANRRAAFLYLLMAQIGAILILLSFGVLAAFAGEFTFAALRETRLPPPWAGVAFWLGLAGFGMKAGIVPLHVWLPDAHPAAPSHVSALMSGVMLKVAVYGFLRLVFDLLGDPHWSWGVLVLVVGSVTAVYGVLYALTQQDLKRLLAYSSIENIGIVYIGIGLSMIFFSAGLPVPGVLGLVGALYHAVNHTLFKTLLFLGAGALLQRARESNLDHMGGLIRRMPWTAAFFLAGCLGIAALPPLNGFVSEWLIFQTALQATALDSGVLRALIPIAAALLALTGALAAACFVRAFGIIFLGQPRTRRVRHSREASPGMVLAQGALALLCLLIGVLPTQMIGLFSGVSRGLTGYGVFSAAREGWLWLTPVAPEVASYSAPLVLLGVCLALVAWGAVYLWLRPARRAAPVPRRDQWDCGFGAVGARMQYSAAAFAMPIRHVFRPLYRLREEKVRDMDTRLPTRPVALRYLIHADEITWPLLYTPVERLVQAAARRIAWIQTGQLRHYLAYSFFTLIGLLWLIT
jgi:formate hydrogenlyase subunit 3/multisubunit Na+/H+ antiporter MnhD subunit